MSSETSNSIHRMLFEPDSALFTQKEASNRMPLFA